MNEPVSSEQGFPSSLSAHTTLLGNYYFNTYLVRGERACAIVETGVSATVDDLIGQLESLSVRPGYIVVTHPHADHLTGLAGLREKYPHAMVIMGKGAEDFAKHPKAAAAMSSEDRHISSMLEKKGVRPGRPPVDSVPDLSDAREVDGSTNIDLGGATLRCFPVKGHAPGGIAVHVPEDKTLLISDCLGFHYPGRGFCPLYFTGFQEYIDTIRKLESLSPEIIGPGHQGPVSGDHVQQAFRNAVRAAEQTARLAAQTERSNEEIREELFRTYYVDEFTLYSRENIMNCMKLLVRRAKEAGL